MEYFVSIVVGTFILEDVALAASVALVSNGKMSFASAFTACFIGICIGDCALYFIGKLISRFKIERKIKFLQKYASAVPSDRTKKFMTYSVVISRFVPGTRIPTYVGAGLINYSFTKFFILTLLSVAPWVLFILLGGKSMYKLFEGNWIVALFALFIFLGLAKSIIPQLMNYWHRRALLHSWRKWTHFEFWPAWFFYSPIVFLYIFRSLKGRSFILPFYSNPQILNAGLIGESKWDFIKHLNPQDPTTLKTILLDKSLSISERRSLIESSNFKMPFILKPDVGQRGYGVRIIRNEIELEDYLKESQALSLVVQRLSSFSQEAGIFYYRKPSESVGTLFSITDKKFPFVVGDGRSRLGDLILSDQRARIIAPLYFERHKKHLYDIIPIGEKIIISECGNHCQGAIFLNGHYLKTNELAEKIDSIAKSVPDFYFGRVDVKYKNVDQLKLGLDFEIVEINGAGAEATHIWDENTSIIEAYKVLYHQWRILFEIGQEVKQQKRDNSNVKIWAFLKEVLRVVMRKDPISVSS